MVPSLQEGLPHQDFDVARLGPCPTIGEDDVLVVECKHGYTQLLQKMVAAYRTLLVAWKQATCLTTFYIREPWYRTRLLSLSKERYTVKFFIRADVDSMLPLQFLLPLLDHAAAGRCLVLLRLDGLVWATCITLNYITLHYITLYYIILHCITLYYIILHYITVYYIILHYITLHDIAVHYITLHYITLHYIA